MLKVLFLSLLALFVVGSTGQPTVFLDTWPGPEASGSRLDAFWQDGVVHVEITGEVRGLEALDVGFEYLDGTRITTLALKGGKSLTPVHVFTSSDRVSAQVAIPSHGEARWIPVRAVFEDGTVLRTAATRRVLGET